MRIAFKVGLQIICFEVNLVFLKRLSIIYRNTKMKRALTGRRLVRPAADDDFKGAYVWHIWNFIIQWNVKYQVTLSEFFFVYIHIIKYYLLYFSRASFFKCFVRFCLYILYKYRFIIILFSYIYVGFYLHGDKLWQ